MAENSHFLSVGKEQLHCLKWGRGKRLLLAFHGYGNTARIFELFKSYLEHEFTILSFDLPHHGSTAWQNELRLQKKDLLAAVREIMLRYQVDKVSLLGYSMGGRVCMTLVEHIPELVDKVVLLATDGLAVNRLYYFCTRNFIGKRLFNDILERPQRYFRLIEWLKSTQKLDPTRYKFAMQHLQSAEIRNFLKQRWNSLSDFIPDPARLKRAVRQHHIPVSIFMGVYDRIMPPKLAEKFAEGLDTVQVIIFEKGHRVFDETNAAEIAQHLL